MHLPVQHIKDSTEKEKDDFKKWLLKKECISRIHSSRGHSDCGVNYQNPQRDRYHVHLIGIESLQNNDDYLDAISDPL